MTQDIERGCEMIHLDLFSGIAGFALAVDEVWPGSEHIFCEVDPYCKTLLKLRYPKARIYGDIRQLTADTESRQSRQSSEQEGREDFSGSRCDILTGGFPCQPFSQAGKRRGTEDNRYLWPEMLRVIKDFSPRWVIAENVRGLINISNGVVFEQVCLDLEAQGYEVQAFIIPAVAVGAPHRRDRVWVVANRTSTRQSEKGRQIRPDNGQMLSKDRKRLRNVSNAEDTNAPDTERSGEQGFDDRPRQEQFRRSDWEQNWLTVASRICILDDGLPAELDGFKLSKSRHRVERLKALGNAIVPQVAVELMKAIAYSDIKESHIMKVLNLYAGIGGNRKHI